MTLLSLTIYLQKFKHYSLIISKCLTLGLSCYYLYNYNEYSLTFHVPEILRFNFVIAFTGFLDNIGMFFLLFPVTIIICTFYYPQYRILNLLSLFFSFFTNIFTIALAIKRMTIQEFFNARIFTIYNIYSEETKKSIFKSHLDAKLEVSKLTIDQYKFIQDCINETFNTEYLPKLRITPIAEIPFLVNSMLEKINKQFLELTLPKLPSKNFSSISDSWNYIYAYLTIENGVKALLGAGFLYGAYKLYKVLFSGDQEQAEIVKDGLLVGQEQYASYRRLLKQA